MEGKEKIGAVHFVLLGLTLAFLASLAVLSRRDPAGSAEGWTVETEYTAAAEETPAAGRGVDINSADAGELQALPGVGPVLAQAIVDYREAHGPFAAPEELMEVDGIGESKLDAMRDSIILGEGDNAA